jgi:RDD family
MGSALLNTTTGPEFSLGEESAPAEAPQGSAEALRAQVAERLAAHRRRRGGEAAQPSRPEPPRQGNTRSAQIAAAVAERYAHTQSYRAFLAAEADRAIQQARAAAEVAALNAQVVAAAQQRLLEAFDEHASAQSSQEEMRAAEVLDHREHREQASGATHAQPAAAVEQNLWADLEPALAPQQKAQHRRRPQPPAGEAPASDLEPRSLRAPRTSNLEPARGLTVRLYEDAASAAHVDFGHPRHAAAGHTNRREERNEAEARALDEEIAFRQAPVFEEPAGPPVPLPANLIEFPRQLVASRKARPRYAEGPLRDEGEAAPGDGQLRIFEVDPAQISTRPAGDADADSEESPQPQWTSIWLDTPPEAAESDDDARHGYSLADAATLPAAAAIPTIQPASIQRRVLACAINTAIVFTAVLAFAATFLAVCVRGIAWPSGGSRVQALRLVGASIAAHTGLQPLQAAAIAAAAGAFLVLLYHALFFWFSDATPGMRCARIGLCTFDDENPTRRAVRRRLGAMLLSACPLGLGFALAALDEERLTWHDRMTKMYLRSY